MTLLVCFLLAFQLGADAPAVELSREPVPERGPKISVRGFVKTPEGEPVSAAVVVLRAKASVVPIDGLLHTRDVLARTKTDQAGAFQFKNVGIAPRFTDSISALQRQKAGAELVAWSDGRALAWKEVSEFSPAEAATFVLGPEADVRGVLKDPAGKGISGVRVSITGATPAKKNIDHFFRSPGDVNLFRSEIEPAVLTDEEGRFAFHHAPLDYRMSMVIDHPAFAREFFVVDTGKDVGLTEIGIGEQWVANPMKWPVKRLPLEMSLRTAFHARVKVVDAGGKAVTSGTVGILEGFNTAGLSPAGEAWVRIGKPGKNRFRYVADPLDPALSVITSADIPETGDPLVEIRLPEPLWLTGKVVNPETKEGVVGAAVYYGSATSEGASSVGARAISGQGGAFKIPVVAGKGTLRIFGTVHRYIVPSYFAADGKSPAPGLSVDIPAEGPIETVTLKLGRGLVIRGMVTGNKGQPVAGATVAAHNDDQDRMFRSDITKTDAEGKYELAALSPLAETYIIASAAAGSTYTKVAGAPDHPSDEPRILNVKIELQPGVALSGQAFRNAKPYPGLMLRLSRPIREANGRYFVFGEAVTDAEGRYRFAGLNAGDQYHIEIEDVNGLAAPGWRHQSPYVSAVQGGPEVTLPDMHLVALNQRLAGMVVDPKGKPLAGISVSAQMPDRSSIPRTRDGPPPYAVTDDAGGFELQQLPEGQIMLMAYKANPAGGLIRFPSYTRPKVGDDKIRIIFDPELTQEVEDLDKPDKEKP